MADIETLSEEIRTLDAASRVTRTPVGDGSMAWREWGKGDPLLLLHGSHGGWMHWLRNIPELARTRRVIVPDMPGFGESDPPTDIDSPVEHARALAEGLRRLDGLHGPIDVIAFSLGALMGCYLTLEKPDIVRRLIVVDAGGLGTPVITADLRSLKGVKDDEAIRAANRHNLAAMMIHDPATIDETAVDISIFCGKRVRTRVQFQVIPDKMLAAVRRVRVPIDVIWGEHDYIHPGPELNADAIRTAHPEAKLRVVARAGHWPMYEQPGGFNAAALDLLARPLRPRMSDASRADGEQAA
ncbi:alpha/beta fold hydrolase [soil metagenome]